MLKKPVRISNSGMSRYMGCGRSYQFHYIDKWRSHIKSSALFFGSAVDVACNFMLENFDKRNEPFFRDEAYKLFQKTWTSQFDKDSNTLIELRCSPNIKYFKSDFDLEVLNAEDLEELGLASPEDVKSYLDSRKLMEAELKANGGRWDLISIEDRVEHNEITWFCLLRKGYYMIDAYWKEILPEFESILCLQRPIELEDENKNVVNGIAEFVAKIKDGRICIVDNKTAGTPYEPESVSTSQQLALYKQIMNIQATEGGEWTTPIECAAYAVMSKKINKDKVKTCQSCGYIADSSHKTCNAKVDGKRCDGEWTVVTSLSASTQFIVDNISEDFGNTVLENASTIVACIEKGIFPKNFSKCHDDYGSTCQFLHLCHKGDKSNLYKVEAPNGEKK